MSRNRTRAALLLMSPALMVFAGFFVCPLLWLLRISFYEALSGGLMAPAWVFDNYRRFLFDTFHLKVLWTTLRLGLTVTLVCLVLGYPVAYSLARTRSRRLRGIGITALLVPLMTSVVIRSYGWMVLLASSGLVNSVLVRAGLVKQPLQLMFTFPGVVIALSEVLLPFMVLSIMPVVQNVDRSLEQASASLGASPWATFRRIVLPLTMPGVAAGSILVFVLAISAFATPRLVGGSRTQVMGMFIYDQAMSLFNWPFGSAVSFVLVTVVLTLTFLQGRLLEGNRRQA